jgi:hypothetical protein
VRNDVARKAAWGLVLPLLLAMDTASYRFHRPIEGAAGWTSVELAEDVLDAARPGLADVRVLGNGEEVPYTLDAAPAVAPARLALFDVEQSGKETTALLDRGALPPRADSLELLVDETDFIKPVAIDASNDRLTWRSIGRGSIFATRSGVRLLRVQFAPSDHRYWRVVLDDRNGSALKVSHVIVGATASREEPRRTLPIELKAEPDISPSASTWSAVLPHRNLRLTALSIGASDAAFARRVRVFERVWFRDEVSRRLLGEAEIVRAPGGGEPSNVPLSEPVGKQIEIDIDRAGGVPLHDVSAQVSIAPRVLRFHAREGQTLELAYGAEESSRPSYDLGAALDGGPPPLFAPARLGPAIDTGAGDPALPAVVRGGTLDRSGWRNEQPIVLPPRGPIAYLDVDRGAGGVDDLRIVDAAGRQVPYIVEREPRHARFPLAHRSERKGNETHIALDGLQTEKALQAIELEIAAPEYFTRQITVYERTTDERGTKAPRLIGSMRLVKTAEAPTSRFRIPIAEPERPNLEIVVDDGDNAPLVVQTATAEVARRRLNFIFETGDDLKLLSGNDRVPVPSYDLSLVAVRVLASPAEPATLGETRTIAKTPRPPTPGWFWIFVFAAAVILFAVLGRTLTGTPAKPS